MSSITSKVASAGAKMGVNSSGELRSVSQATFLGGGLRALADDRQGIWRVLSVAYIVSVFALPQYFGLPLPGFALTAQRIITIVLAAAILCSRGRSRSLGVVISSNKANVLFLPILFVYAYTAVAASSPNSFMGFFVDSVVAFYLIGFLIRDILGLEGFVDVLVRVIAIVCCVAIFDMARRWNPYQLIHTIASIEGGSGWRGSSYRVAGMCSHPIAFGMYLMLVFPVLCIDINRRKVDIFKHPAVAALACFAMLGTGSRGPIACFVVELLAAFALTEGGFKKKYSGYIFVGLITLLFVLIAFNKERHIDRWVWLNFFQIVDELLNTDFTTQRYGVWQAKLTSASSEYREYLPLIFVSPDLDPLVGQGNQGEGISFSVGEYNIASVDNFYACQYINYAWPGVVAAVIMFAGVLISCLIWWRKNSGNRVFLVFAIVFILYYVNLWTVANLNTFKYYLPMFALAYELAEVKGVPRGALANSRRRYLGEIIRICRPAGIVEASRS